MGRMVIGLLVGLLGLFGLVMYGGWYWGLAGGLGFLYLSYGIWLGRGGDYGLFSIREGGGRFLHRLCGSIILFGGEVRELFWRGLRLSYILSIVYGIWLLIGGEYAFISVLILSSFIIMMLGFILS
jgi:hypothetical protein